MISLHLITAQRRSYLNLSYGVGSGSASAAQLEVLDGKFVNQDGEEVTLKGVNWYGFNVSDIGMVRPQATGHTACPCLQRCQFFSIDTLVLPVVFNQGIPLI
jgi:hypothetical protein